MQFRNYLFMFHIQFSGAMCKSWLILLFYLVKAELNIATLKQPLMNPAPITSCITIKNRPKLAHGLIRGLL